MTFEEFEEQYFKENQHPLQGAGTPLPTEEFQLLRDRIYQLMKDAFEAGFTEGLTS
jgi:hypothetical protein